MDKPAVDTNRRTDTRVRGFNQDFGAGAFLMAIAAIGYVAAGDLRLTLPSGIGPGTMPKATALILAGFGALLMLQGLTKLGDRLEAWSLRGPLFLLGAVVVFGVSVRTLGLAFAGPFAVIIASLADRETKLLEIIPFALILSSGCILLFKYALRQPIPVAPLLLGY